MAEISAALVKQLREKTGAPMGKCRKALIEADGNVDAAFDLLRAQGVKPEQAARATAEGALAFKLSGDNKGVAVVELRCETDFAAKSDNFVKLLDSIADAVLAEKPADTDAAKAIKSVADGLQEAGAMTIRENVQLHHAEYRTLEGEGKIGFYLHHNGSVGTVVGLQAPAGAADDKVDALLRDVAMHVTAHDPTPVAVDRESIPAEIVQREKTIYLKQIDENEKDRNKPENIKEKMIEGRMRKFYEERSLLEQKFVKNPEQTVKALLEQAGKDLGGDVKVAWFERRSVGG